MTAFHKSQKSERTQDHEIAILDGDLKYPATAINSTHNKVQSNHQCKCTHDNSHAGTILTNFNQYQLLSNLRLHKSISILDYQTAILVSMY